MHAAPRRCAVAIRTVTTPPNSDLVTDGIRVRAAAEFVPDESDPARPSYLFGYRIVMTNEGNQSATLEARHWTIVDGNGRRSEVRGAGVVGEFPTLHPGDQFEYSSRCPLTTSWGTMEGSYRFRRPDGTRFDARVGRFFLAMNAPPIAQQLERDEQPTSAP
ncbi:MAG: Co2+/Mg2+ efflux protein ApaG [Planctomycetes bacterium]|nr:Co2+/Mg2+ efflux protein ApaG [Planctomycetota bacterium]